MRRKLFNSKERVNTYVKFNLRSQLRGDQQTEAEYLARMVLTSVMTPNEARAYLELNPIKGNDELLQPVNTLTDTQREKDKKDE